MKMNKGMPFAVLIMFALLMSIACGGAEESTTTTTTTSSESTSSQTTEQDSTSSTEAESASEGTAAESATLDASGEFIDCPNFERFCHFGTSAGRGEKPKYGGIAILAHRRDLPGTDPMFTGTISTNNVTSGLFGKGNLIREKRSNTFEWVPQYASAWKMSDDSKTWDFTLRDGLTWHDGTPVTVKDVKFWLDLNEFPPEGRRKSTASSQGKFGDLISVETPDSKTIRLNMESPQPNLLEGMMGAGLMMAHPQHLIQPELDAENFRVQPSEIGYVGMGPYVFKEYDQGSLFQYRRFDNYYEVDEWGQQKPYLDGIDYVIMRDRSATVSAFRANRLDGTSRGTGFHLVEQDIDAIKRDLGDKAYFISFPYVSWGPSMNATKAPLDDINLRQALNLWADRQAGLKMLYGGYGYVTGIFVTGSPYANPDVLEWPGFNPATKEQDQAAAKKLLKDNGYEGLAIEITCRENYIAVCEYQDGMWRNLGLDTNINLVDTNLLQELQIAGDFQLNTTPGGAALPGDIAAAYLTTNQYSPHKHNDMYIDETFGIIAASVDQAERARLAQDLERYIIKEQAYYPAWFREPGIIAYRSTFKGVHVPGNSTSQNNSMTDAWFDDGRTDR